MNLLNECTSSEIELIEKAGITIENKDYGKEEIKKCQLQMVEYIVSHSSKNGDIDRLSNQYSSIFRTIEGK